MGISAEMTLLILGNNSSALKAMREVGAEAGATEAKTSKAGKVMNGLALGVVGLGSASLEAAVHFEKQITLLQTATNESGNNLKMIGDGIMLLSTQSGVSTEQLAEGMYTVEKAGFRAGAGLNVLKAAAQGSKEEGVQLSVMTDALTSVMKSYNIPADQAATTMSQLARAAGDSKTNMTDFATSLHSILPLASSVHLSFDEVGGAIATMTQHGESAQQATVNLNNALRNIVAPNQVARNEMNQLGINVADLQTHVGERGLTGTYDLMIKAMGRVSPAGTILVDEYKKSGAAGADLTEMYKHMPAAIKGMVDKLNDGTFSTGDFRKAIKQLTPEQFAMGQQYLSLRVRASGFSDMLRSGQPANQTAIDALKKMTGGATGMNTALMLTGSNMPGFKLKVKDIGSQVATTNGDTATWAATSKTASTKLDEVRASIHVLGIKLGTELLPVFKDFLDKLVSAAGWLEKNWSWVSKLGIAVGGLVLGIKAIKLGIDAWKGAQLALDILLDANPLGAFVIAVGILAAAIADALHNWQQLKDAFTTNPLSPGSTIVGGSNPFAPGGYENGGSLFGGGFMGGNATGGQIEQGWSMVGEKGPEMVHRSGGTVRVFNNQDTQQRMGNSGGNSGGGDTHIHVNVTGLIAGQADTVARYIYDISQHAKRRGSVPAK